MRRLIWGRADSVLGRGLRSPQRRPAPARPLPANSPSMSSSRPVDPICTANGPRVGRMLPRVHLSPFVHRKRRDCVPTMPLLVSLAAPSDSIPRCRNVIICRCLLRPHRLPLHHTPPAPRPQRAASETLIHLQLSRCTPRIHRPKLAATLEAELMQDPHWGAHGQAKMHRLPCSGRPVSHNAATRDSAGPG